MAEELLVCDKESAKKAHGNVISHELRGKQIEAEKASEEKANKKSTEANKKSPYKEWVQLNNKSINYLVELSNINPTALGILLFLIQNMDGTNAVVCSYKVLEEKFNKSASTLKRSIKFLKEKGFIYTYKTGTSNVYVINTEVVWKSYGRNQKYCKFPANVIISMSEQDDEKHYKPLKLNTVLQDGKLIDESTGEILS